MLKRLYFLTLPPRVGGEYNGVCNCVPDSGVPQTPQKAPYYLLLNTLCVLWKDLYRRGKNINISFFHTIVGITPVPQS
jgi:hypothetical protein